MWPESAREFSDLEQVTPKVCPSEILDLELDGRRRGGLQQADTNRPTPNSRNRRGARCCSSGGREHNACDGTFSYGKTSKPVFQRARQLLPTSTPVDARRLACEPSGASAMNSVSRCSGSLVVTHHGVLVQPTQQSAMCPRLARPTFSAAEQCHSYGTDGHQDDWRYWCRDRGRCWWSHIHRCAHSNISMSQGHDMAVPI